MTKFWQGFPFLLLQTASISIVFSPNIGVPNWRHKPLMLSQNPTQVQEAVEAKAISFIESLVATNYTDARDSFSPDLREDISETVLRQKWDLLVLENGAYQKVLNSRYQETLDLHVVGLTIEFERQTREVLVIFNDRQ